MKNRNGPKVHQDTKENAKLDSQMEKKGKEILSKNIELFGLGLIRRRRLNPGQRSQKFKNGGERTCLYTMNFPSGRGSTTKNAPRLEGKQKTKNSG